MRTWKTHPYPPRKWRTSPRFIALLMGICATAGLLTACGSGGSGGSATPASAEALTLPSRITLSSAEGVTNSAALAQSPMAALSARHRAPSAYSDAGSDYTAQVKQTWLEDTDVLDMVNDILGVVADSGYENFVNAGPYKALVKPVGDEQQSQGGTSSTSTTAEQLMEITVDVTRESASAPMIVKVWVKEEEGPGGAPMLIRGYFAVSQGVSTQYPYGVLEAHFKANSLDSAGAEGDQVFTMAMSIGADEEGRVIVQFLDQGAEEGPQGGTYIWDLRGRIVADSTLTSGNAYTYTRENNWDTGELEEETVYYAYNGDYFKYQAAGSVDETTLDKNDLRHKIFKYKLFDYNSGAKVTRNSGFGIRLPGGQYGYIGYHGLWTSHGVTATDGDTITRADNDTPYTLVKVGGKLTKHTRASIALSALNGVEISVWDQGADLVVVWDAAEETFKKIGTRNMQNGQIQYLDPAAYQNYTFPNEWSGGYCNALSANLPLGRLTPANSDTVYYNTQETVSGKLASDLTLYYWGFALPQPITQDALNNAEAAYQAYFAAGPPVKKTYTFDATANVLRDSESNEILIGAGLSLLAGTKYHNGYNLFPMTTDDTYDATNCWSIQDSEVYYTWTTGNNQWNQFTTARDADGALTVFDPPLSFTYQHQTANDVNADATHNGRTFKLDFDGSNLQVPWSFDAAAGEWWPTFGLKDGTVLTDANGHSYVLKAVEEALIMADAADPSLAEDLVIDMTVEPPSIAYDASKTALVGDVPSDAVLKVIKGELVAD
jgi:hypothetical protein